ncbi:MAG: SprB repeat-containing protein, partial [Flavobacteriales bacterium]|nr:SprB repeat-containing protein [Flavobacteriales bacterium]
MNISTQDSKFFGLLQKSNIMLLFLFLSSSILSAQIVNIGGDTLVNTTTVNSQQNAKVAMDDDGNYLVVWESDGQDGDGFGVYGQWYDADGTLNGSEFQVNSITENDQRFPAVAVTEDGRASIVWVEDEEDGSGWTLNCRIYRSSHTAITTAFSIRTSSNGQQRWPDVHMDNSGNTYVTWTQVSNDLSTYTIYAQVRNSIGVDLTGIITINDVSSSFNGYSKIGVEENGDFAVTWQILGSDNATTHGILCERFNSAGVSQGTEFQVNTEVSGYQISPDIAMDSTGNFTVVWTSAGQDGDEDGIYGQRYTNAGATDDSEFQISTTTAGFQNHPSIGMSKEGSAAVAWNSYGTDGSFDGIYLQAYNADGTTSGTETLMNTRTTDFQQFAEVAAYSISNNMVVVWADGLVNSTSTHDGSGYGIFSQRFSIAAMLVASAAVSSAIDCNGDTDGQVTASETGGTAPYTYIWNTGGFAALET